MRQEDTKKPLTSASKRQGICINLYGYIIVQN